MKKYTQEPILVLKLEKDEEGNLSGMQARVWKLNNGTTVVLRLFEHSTEARKKLWDGVRTIEEVDVLMFEMLQNFRVIQKNGHWSYTAGDFYSQDEFEERDRCHYFSWNVERRYLNF